MSSLARWVRRLLGHGGRLCWISRAALYGPGGGADRTQIAHGIPAGIADRDRRVQPAPRSRRLARERRDAFPRGDRRRRLRRQVARRAPARGVSGAGRGTRRPGARARADGERTAKIRAPTRTTSPPVIPAKPRSGAEPGPIGSISITVAPHGPRPSR